MSLLEIKEDSLEVVKPAPQLLEIGHSSKFNLVVHIPFARIEVSDLLAECGLDVDEVPVVGTNDSGLLRIMRRVKNAFPNQSVDEQSLQNSLTRVLTQHFRQTP